MDAWIKYFFLIFSGLYSYASMLKPSGKCSSFALPVHMLVSFILSFAVCLLHIYAAPIRIPGMLILSFLAFTVLSRTPWKVSAAASVLSFGCSYFFFAVSAVLLSATEALLINMSGVHPPKTLLSLILGLLQLLGVICLFRTRRLSHGLSFLWNPENNDAGIFIGASILTAVSFLSLNQDTHFIYLVLIFSVLIWGTALLFWWRERITRKYLEQIHTRTTCELQETISKDQKEIAHLRQQNEALAGMIHKDNKLIPAMEHSIRELLHSAAGESGSASLQKKSANLLKELESVFQDRQGLLRNYEAAEKQIPSTGITSIDILLSYMLQKAAEQHVDFDVTIPENILPVTKQIPGEDLRTLLADLLENALISASENETKKVLLAIGHKNNFYMMEIYDSGPPFSREVLSHLGLGPVTTHKEEGGSGIGLMTILALCAKYSASFAIEDLSGSLSCLYSKKVSVRFDGLGTQTVPPSSTW